MENHSKLSVYVVSAPDKIGFEEFFFSTVTAAKRFCAQHQICTRCIEIYDMWSDDEIYKIDYKRV